MKQAIYTAMLAAGFLAALPLQAATQYATQQEAAAQVTKDGYILVVYAKGWDRFSEPLCKKVIKSKAVQEAAGDAALILAPFYQYASEDDKKAQRAVWGNLAEPRANSMETYPCLLMYDQGGFLYGRVQGPVLLRGTMEEIAAEVKAKLDAKHQQEAIMAKADAAQGVERARLIAEACAIKGIERPNNYRNLVKQADPNDESGMVRRLHFDPWGTAQKYCASAKDGGKQLGTAGTVQEMQQMLEDPAYDNEQKQVFHAIIIGTMRRDSVDTYANQLRTHLAEMKRLAPESNLGVTADQYTKLYLKGEDEKKKKKK